MSLFFRNLIFTLLQPGVVVFLVPYFMIWRDHTYPESWSVLHYLGFVLIVSGFLIMMACIARFGTHGKGTLSPADPTRLLVTSGLYRYSRNPMYIGVLTMLIGQAIFAFSTLLWIYTLIIFIIFNAFIFLIEEPRLRRDFGNAYLSYCKRVKRWV